MSKFLKQFDGRKGGTYVIVSAGGQWGRGATIAEARDNAGGADKWFTADTCVVAWQPVNEFGPPDVDGYGCIAYYGDDLEYLWRPSQA